MLHKTGTNHVASTLFNPSYNLLVYTNSFCVLNGIRIKASKFFMFKFNNFFLFVVLITANALSARSLPSAENSAKNLAKFESIKAQSTAYLRQCPANDSLTELDDCIALNEKALVAEAEKLGVQVDAGTRAARMAVVSELHAKQAANMAEYSKPLGVSGTIVVAGCIIILGSVASNVLKAALESVRI